MYWYNFLTLLTIFLQTEQPHIDVSFNLLELGVGVAIGLVPGIITAYAARKKWYGGEQNVVRSQADMNETEAIENIATAASLIATQSQALSDKSATLIGLLEEEVSRQQTIIEQERTLRANIQEQNESEINKLKAQIEEINSRIEACSVQLKELIEDLKLGKAISQERLDQLESSLP